jgi:peptide deformylase
MSLRFYSISLLIYLVYKLLVECNGGGVSLQRPKSVRVEAQDIKGKKFAMTLKEWQARIFQHEYDHLEVPIF